MILAAWGGHRGDRSWLTPICSKETDFAWKSWRLEAENRDIFNASGFSQSGGVRVAVLVETGESRTQPKTGPVKLTVSFDGIY